MLNDKLIKHFDHISCPVTAPRPDAKTLPGELIDDTQDTDALSVGCLVMHKIPAPDLIGHGRPESLVCALVNPSCPALFFPDLQAVTAPHPLNPLRIDLLAITFENCGNPPVAIAWLVLAELDNVTLKLAACCRECGQRVKA